MACEERPVPQSEVPLEHSSKTQPFPLKPPPLVRMTMSEADVATVTPELEAACKKLLEGVQLGGPYLPPAYNRLRVQFPGNHGGVNWGGTSFNPQLGYLFVNTNELGQLSGQKDHDPKSGRALAKGAGNRVDPDGPYEGVPGGGRLSIPGSSGSLAATALPATPVGRIDRREREHRRVCVARAAGRHRQSARRQTEHRAPRKRRHDCHRRRAGIRRRDRRRPLPRVRCQDRQRSYGPSSSAAPRKRRPMTYQGRDGRQYVVITSTGGGFFNNPVTSDAVTAFALDQE